MNLFEELKWRELIYDVTDEQIAHILNNTSATFYLGADPTGESLHVGHLVVYLFCQRLLKHGHNPILVIGGSTGLIGDPKAQGERKLLTLETTLANSKKIGHQVETIFGFKTIVNNYDWTKDIDVITYLRDFGKYFNINYMLNKDIVKSRLDSGISYTEFSYQILQSLDWLHLYQKYHCTIQIGGQDQWGNITAGVELIRKREGSEAKVYGITIPLVTKSDGTKFGKTESGSVWLDRSKTSAYEFYQFWINTSDVDVTKRLKQFTFLTKAEIEAILVEFTKNPEKRYAQERLAEEVTLLVHGKEALLEAKRITEALFSGEISKLSSEEILIGLKDLPYIEAQSISLIDALVETNLASSKREAKEFIQANSITVNGEKVNTLDFIINHSTAIEGKVCVIRRGKKKYSVIKISK